MYLYFIMGGRRDSEASGYGGANDGYVSTLYLIRISYIDVGMFAKIVSLKTAVGIKKRYKIPC